jgi:polyhydroxybutyrate depolymerase
MVSSLPLQLNVPFGQYDGACDLYLPLGFNPKKGKYPAGGYPLVMIFHGNGGTGRGMERTTNMDLVADGDYDPVAQTGGFIVAYPQGRSLQWDFDGSAGDDVNYIMNACIPLIQAGWPINMRRIHLMGYSDGGAMMIDTVQRNPGFFASIGMVDYNFNAANASAMQASSPIEFLVTHGTADPVIPYNGGVAHSGQTVSSSAQTAQLLATLNGCGTPTTTNPAGSLNTTPNATATVDIATIWAPGTTGLGGSFYTATGGGHTWPGGTQPPTANLDGQLIGYTDIALNISQLFWNQVKATLAAAA